MITEQVRSSMLCQCGLEATYVGPDPFDSEINGNNEEVELCEECYMTSVGDI